ncbi:MAG: hypothetical protein RQ752_16135 [Thermohalobaculum sp.]|nr:hypothetical protein [Thermohalobaculum sp.]
MIRFGRLVGPVVLLAAFGAAAAQFGVLRSEPVDARYSVSGGTFDTGGDLIVMLRAFETDGRVGICGAKTRTRESAMSLPYGHFVEGAGVVQLAGARIFQGIRRLPEYPFADDMTGVSAKCMVADRAWRPEFDTASPVVRFARMPFGGEGRGDYDTIFRSAPVPDVIRRP